MIKYLFKKNNAQGKRAWWLCVCLRWSHGNRALI